MDEICARSSWRMRLKERCERGRRLEIRGRLTGSVKEAPAWRRNWAPAPPVSPEPARAPLISAPRSNMLSKIVQPIDADLFEKLG